MHRNSWFLRQSNIYKEISRNVFKYFEQNESKNTTYQTIWNKVNAMLRGKFIALTSGIIDLVNYRFISFLTNCYFFIYCLLFTVRFDFFISFLYSLDRLLGHWFSSLQKFFYCQHIKDTSISTFGFSCIPQVLKCGKFNYGLIKVFSSFHCDFFFDSWVL